MKKKLLVLFLTIVSTVCLTFGLAGCDLLTEIANTGGSSSNSSSGGSSSGIDSSGVDSSGGNSSGGSSSGVDSSGVDSSGGNSSGVDSSGSKSDDESDIESGGEIDEAASEGLNYKKSGSGYEVSGIGDCADEEIVISSTYNGISVVSIGDEAFKDCSSLTSVIV